MKKRDADTLIKLFYEQQHAKMLGLLKKLGASPELAEDILQEALLSTYTKLMVSDDCIIDSFAGYVWKTAQNKYYNHLRDNAKKKTVSIDEIPQKTAQEEPYFSLHEETAYTKTLQFLEEASEKDCKSWLDSLIPPLTELRKQVLLDVLRTYRENYQKLVPKKRKELAQEANKKENTFYKLFGDAAKALGKILKSM